MLDSIIYDLCKIDAEHGVVSIIRDHKSAVIVIETASPIFTADGRLDIYHNVKAFTFLPVGQERFEVKTEHCSIGYVMGDDRFGRTMVLGFLKGTPTKEELFATIGVARGESESWQVPIAKLARLEEIIKDRSFIDEKTTSHSWATLKMSAIGINVTPTLPEGGVGRTWFRGGDLGRTLDAALLQASADGRFDEAKDLLDRGANINVVHLPSSSLWGSLWRSVAGSSGSRDPYSGNTPLMNATSYGHLPLVQLLVARGARLDIVNANRHTALDLAVLKAFPDIVNYLTSKRAPMSSTTPGDLMKMLSSGVLVGDGDLEERTGSHNAVPPDFHDSSHVPFTTGFMG